MNGNINFPTYQKRIGNPTGKPQRQPAARTDKVPQDFKAVLDKKLQNSEIKFSAHAQKRLEMRGIKLGKQEMDRLSSAVEKAASKGARESLILLGDVALVTSITNRTVITAVDGESMKENVFTNIDSAVIT